jgi:hypothetical protein
LQHGVRRHGGGAGEQLADGDLAERVARSRATLDAARWRFITRGAETLS